MLKYVRTEKLSISKVDPSKVADEAFAFEVS